MGDIYDLEDDYALLADGKCPKCCQTLPCNAHGYGANNGKHRMGHAVRAVGPVDTVRLTAETDLRYKLREKPHASDGYPLAAGDSLHITKEAVGWFHAVEAKTGKRTKAYKVTPHRTHT